MRFYSCYVSALQLSPRNSNIFAVLGNLPFVDATYSARDKFLNNRIISIWQWTCQWAFSCRVLFGVVSFWSHWCPK